MYFLGSGKQTCIKDACRESGLALTEKLVNPTFAVECIDKNRYFNAFMVNTLVFFQNDTSGFDKFAANLRAATARRSVRNIATKIDPRNLWPFRLIIVILGHIFHSHLDQRLRSVQTCCPPPYFQVRTKTPNCIWVFDWSQFVSLLDVRTLQSSG